MLWIDSLTSKIKKIKLFFNEQTNILEDRITVIDALETEHMRYGSERPYLSKVSYEFIDYPNSFANIAFPEDDVIVMLTNSNSGLNYAKYTLSTELFSDDSQSYIPNLPAYVLPQLHKIGTKYYTYYYGNIKELDTDFSSSTDYATGEGLQLQFNFDDKLYTYTNGVKKTFELDGTLTSTEYVDQPSHAKYIGSGLYSIEPYNQRFINTIREGSDVGFVDSLTSPLTLRSLYGNFYFQNYQTARFVGDEFIVATLFSTGIQLTRMEFR